MCFASTTETPICWRATPRRNCCENNLSQLPRNGLAPELGEHPLVHPYRRTRSTEALITVTFFASSLPVRRLAPSSNELLSPTYDRRRPKKPLPRQFHN